MATRTEQRADERRVEVLDAAAHVFLRFGYRKASMDDVAAAVGLSRQALYLRFASKDDLFRAAVEHVLATSLSQARAALRAPGELVERVVSGYTALHGAHLGNPVIVQNMAELVEVATAIMGPGAHAATEPFIDDVARALSAAGLVNAGVAAKERVGKERVSARDMAATIDAASRGIKHSVASVADYQREMTRVVRVVCRGGAKR